MNVWLVSASYLYRNDYKTTNLLNTKLWGKLIKFRTRSEFLNLAKLSKFYMENVSLSDAELLFISFWENSKNLIESNGTAAKANDKKWIIWKFSGSPLEKPQRQKEKIQVTQEVEFSAIKFEKVVEIYQKLGSSFFFSNSSLQKKHQIFQLREKLLEKTSEDCILKIANKITAIFRRHGRSSSESSTSSDSNSSDSGSSTDTYHSRSRSISRRSKRSFSRLVEICIFSSKSIENHRE